MAIHSSYPLARWRLLVDEKPLAGAWNMALDEAVMQAVALGDAPPTLRFYQWAPPCLSLGRRQPTSGVDFDGCARDGVEVVRRATGGLAILHTDELTYSIATTPDDPRAAGAILDAYRSLSAGLVAGLRLLGVRPEMAPVASGGATSGSAACFEVPSAYEIVAGDRKLMGSAQVRPHGRVMQHGSLPLHGDIGRIVDCLRFETMDEREALRAHLRERATTLDDALGRTVGFTDAAEALARGFEETLNVRLEVGHASADELRAAERLVEEKRVAAGV